MTAQPDMQRAALWYAHRLNWYVFPIHNPIFDDSGLCVGCSCEYYRRTEECKRQHPHLYLGPDGKCVNPGKCPRVAWGSKSTVDPDQITKWWGRPWRDVDVETGTIIYNQPNLGIDCGKSGLLVFDADTYKEVGDLSDLLTWADRETVTVITQGGGEHLIYDRQGKLYGNATKGLPPGFDIRGVGGYVVGAPSIGKSGRRYQYEEAYRPGYTPLLPIPKMLDDILSDATPQHRARCSGLLLNQPAAIRRSVDLVDRVLAKLGISFDVDAYGAGQRYHLSDCPFMPEDDPHPRDNGSFVLVLDDGRIAAGCSHNRCQKSIEESGGNGWQWLRKLAGMERRRLMVTVTI
ncbi:MAG: bifunctional DNA primase/polymerase [Caldilineaceae bacterium]